MSAHDDRIPWVTWLSGGAAVLVLSATGVLLLSPRADRGAGPGGQAPKGDGTAQAAASATSTQAPTERGTVDERHPLDIAAILTDARTRAGLHFNAAALTGVRLIIDEAKPLGPIEVTYGLTRGRALPGQAVTEKRLRMSYDGAAVTQVDDTDKSPGYVLPDPNCPLEAAFRAATQAGAAPSARHFAVYSHSVRHQRPMWTISAAAGAAYHVDADNCALIVR